MNKTGKTNLDFAGGWIFGGVLIGAIYWILQACLDAYIFGDGKLLTNLLSPDSYQIWMRTLVMSLLVFSSAIVQSMMSRKKRAEDKLNQENSFRTSIIKHAAEGLCVAHQIQTRPYTRFTVWNDRMREITGYTMDEINKQGWYQSLYPEPDTQAKMIERMEQIRSGINVLDEEWDLTRKDGKKRIVRVSTSNIKTRDGVIHVLVLINDITESKKAVENLRRERDIVSGLMDTSPVGIFIFDNKGIVTFANIRAENIIGLSKEKMLGMSHNSPVLHITDFNGQPFPDNKLPFNIVKKTGEYIYNVRLAIQRPDKSKAFLSINAGPIKDDFGKMTGLIASVDDITHKIMSEKALVKSEREKATILESVSELVTYQDVDLKIIWANRAAAESVQRSQGDLIGRYCYQIWNNRETPCPGCPVNKSLEEGEVCDNEIVSEDGRIWYIRGYPVRNDKNEITGIVEVTQDITEKKKNLDSLRQSEAKNRALLNAIPDMIFHMNREGVFLGYEGSEVDLYLPKEKFIGKNIKDVLPEYLADLTMKQIELALTKNELQVYEYELAMNGQDKRYESRLSVCGPDEVIVIVRDITKKTSRSIETIDSSKSYQPESA